MVEPLTVAVIVSLFFSEALKEGGKASGKEAANTFTKLVNTIRSKLKAEGTEGLLSRAEKQPTEANKTKLQEELQTQIEADSAFASQLQELVQQLKSQDETVRQVILSEIKLRGDLKAGDISQSAMQSGSVEQEILKQVEATNIDVGNLNQKA